MSCVCGCESSFSGQRLDVCVGVSKRPDVITFVSGIEKSKRQNTLVTGLLVESSVRNTSSAHHL